MDTDRKDYLKQYRKSYQSRRVNLTLNPNEYKAFLRSARKEKSKLAPYVKKLALSALQDQTHIPASLQEELQTLRFAILNIANNVNQIAHHSHRIHALSEDDEQNLLLYIKQLDSVVRSYTEARIHNPENSHDN